MKQPVQAASGRKYRFEFKHITILFVILIAFQLILSFVHKASLRSFLNNYSEKTEREYVRQLATQTIGTLDFLIRNGKHLPESNRFDLIMALNKSLLPDSSNPALKEICFFVSRGDSTVIIDRGEALLQFAENPGTQLPPASMDHDKAVRMFSDVRSSGSVSASQIYTRIEKDKFLHILYPFTFSSGLTGYIYFKMQPDFATFTREIIASYDETTIIYLSIILLGLLAMYYIATYTAVERDEAEEALLIEHEDHLREQIIHEKESMFTKRIYHTHHKAEKVMGFIKEDLRNLSEQNAEEIKQRVIRYSNFISRVIYDMKWYDPPVHTIRSPFFRTSINELIHFIIHNIFLRISAANDHVSFQIELDPELPVVPINEFVIWEILEPVIQNSIDHGGDDRLTIMVRTVYHPAENRAEIFIEDDGKGIQQSLLEPGDDGVQKIFRENISTKNVEGQNSGYGCYIAYQLATQRCGWTVVAENLAQKKGCRFTFSLPVTPVS
ncbi:MAG: ATP-binding protein [Bacteroidetes bacterium]|nr:ATP-binding protein [Bacteroidota bacterium]